MSLRTSVFGVTESGHEAHLFTLENSHGMRVELTDLGACVVSVRVPDAHGGRPDVCLGYDGVRGYEHSNHVCPPPYQLSVLNAYQWYTAHYNHRRIV